MNMIRFKCIKSATLGITCILAAALLLALSVQVFCSETDQAVAYQINAAHDGSITTSPELQPPLMKKWIVDFNGMVSFPLIAEGKVFVTVNDVYGDYGTRLYAIDAANGDIAWGPIDLHGTYSWSGSTFGNDRVYAVNFDGVIRAFDAGTGDEIWNTKLPVQYAFSSPPVFKNGIVYVCGAGMGATLYAVDASSGNLLWSQSVEGDSSPAVTDDGVYATYGGGLSYKFDPLSGNQVWIHDTGFVGGSSATPAFYDGRLYSRNHYPTWAGFALDALTGRYKGGYDTQTTPAFYNGSGYSIYSGSLQRFLTSNLAVVWNNSLTGLVTPPIIVNGVVYVCSGDGNLYAVDTETGLPVWSTNVGSTILATNENTVYSPLTAMGAGEGIIVVPASNRLVAYGASYSGPLVTCSSPVTLECASANGTVYTATAEVSGSEANSLTVKWIIDDKLVQTDSVNLDATGTKQLYMTYTYPLGDHKISVEVSDGINPAATASTSVNVVDSTPPYIELSVVNTSLNVVNKKFVDLGLLVYVKDAVDTNPAFTTTVYSDEDDINGTSGRQFSPDAILSPTLMLRAECDPTGDGRVYLIVVEATDASGNKTSDWKTVTVPRSNSPKAVEAVKIQAQQMVEDYYANGAEIPAGYFVVGDGPQIDKK